ncbi:hypothetical protein BC828DRAFT_375558 [Blastocladiella britannica]|nr:hypothetical protein BC828DRAFT_375558 [Blastocladiella britannica]
MGPGLPPRRRSERLRHRSPPLHPRPYTSRHPCARPRLQTLCPQWVLLAVVVLAASRWLRLVEAHRLRRPQRRSVPLPLTTWVRAAAAGTTAPPPAPRRRPRSRPRRGLVGSVRRPRPRRAQRRRQGFLSRAACTGRSPRPTSASTTRTPALRLVIRPCPGRKHRC